MNEKSSKYNNKNTKSFSKPCGLDKTKVLIFDR